ncbi:MAG: polysaccharide biosynthesis/export family protein [Tannerellaceae bacterium]|jgi:polysaccharide export outer membrane protein|nr:polysaccharide biosynthesis/export family protein [Tannerellaceae bacterium]
MKKFNHLAKVPLFGLLSLFLLGCASVKDVVYMQDVDPLVKQNIAQNYEMSIQRDDLLAIMVNSKNPELAMPFNLPMVTYQLGTSSSAYGQQRVMGYLVDNTGNIDFPVIGKIKAEGMTRTQLTSMIKTRLVEEELIMDPIVTIQFLNFKISVIGEVNRPGSFSINSDRITLLEALSMAGDLTIYGKRDRVAVIREENGKRTILFHDLRSADLFLSPFYFLQQNDIVYVEPNSARAGQSAINQNNSIGVWLSAVSVLVSVVSMIITLNKK